MHDRLTEIKKQEPTSAALLVPGTPQGFSPPEKLGRFRQTIDRMLQESQMQVTNPSAALEQYRCPSSICKAQQTEQKKGIFPSEMQGALVCQQTVL